MATTKEAHGTVMIRLIRLKKSRDSAARFVCSRILVVFIFVMAFAVAVFSCSACKPNDAEDNASVINSTEKSYELSSVNDPLTDSSAEESYSGEDSSEDSSGRQYGIPSNGGIFEGN